MIRVATQPTYIANPNSKWEHIDFRRLDFEDSRIESYCSALETIYLNGEARYFAFEATDRDAFLSAYHLDHRGFEIQVRSFLRCQAVQECFVVEQGLPYGSPDEVTVIHQGGCQFEGLLADVLLGGGAYEGWSGSVPDARRLAEDCIAGLRSLATQTLWSPFVITQPWCPFFHDIAWDYTFIVQFPYDTRMAIVCATDTD